MHATYMHTLAPSPIYLVPGSDMSLHDDGSPFLLLRSIVQLCLLSALINHGFQVNCEHKHAHARCSGKDKQTHVHTYTQILLKSLLDERIEAILFGVGLESLHCSECYTRPAPSAA